MKPSLIADIGGTNARFALVQADGSLSEPLVLRCEDYKDPAQAARFFLDQHNLSQVDKGAFAVASAITGDWVDLTNSAWRFSIEGTRQELGLSNLSVVNDFTAVALSVPHMQAGDAIRVGGGQAVADCPIAVLGPGTGLGVSALIPDGHGGHTALATEGGHATMAATSEREAKVLDWLYHKLGHVSAERVLSGPGIVNLYEALAAIQGENPAYTTPDAIALRGLDGSNPLCREAIGMFFDMLGTVAGNLALIYGARGGVWLAGGILPRMADAFLASGFRRRFQEKGRFQDYLSPIPVWLMTHPQPAFKGLASLILKH